MRLTRFQTVRGRLLALLVGIAFPIAALTAITAITTYRTVTAGIETTQMRTADDYAVRTRVWYRGALRALLASGNLLARADADCGPRAAAMLSQVPGYRAITVVPRAGDACSASLDPAIGSPELKAALAALRERQATALWGGEELAQTRYDHVMVGGKLWLAVYARVTDRADRPMQEGLLIADTALLDQVFDLGDRDQSLEVALVSGSGTVIVARGSHDENTSWLPAHELVPNNSERWRAQSRAGSDRTYAARLVAEPNFYIVASFDDRLGRAALAQFLVLLLAPLVTLALLCVVYLRAIDNHCVRWLRGIEAAARARSTLTSARALVAPDMPSDIRSVAVAINTMLDEQELRQRKLQTTLDDNRFLVRELHHRVKNSLQVVQSYIGLSKRDYEGEAKLALADAECRVHVLSAAYRFTLADGEMQPVRVDLFVDDVVTMIGNLLRRREQWIVSTVATDAFLPVDRIIPLGFLIVDVMSRALRRAPEVTLRIEIRDLDDRTIEIAMTADRELPHSEPPKLFAGLVTQIEAVQSAAPEGRQLGAWRVVHRP